MRIRNRYRERMSRRMRMNRVLRIVSLFRIPNFEVELSFENKKKSHTGLFFSCGELGIRTLDTLLGYTHFPGVLFRPLRQLSIFEAIGYQLTAISYRLKAISHCQKPLAISHKPQAISQRSANIALIKQKKTPPSCDEGVLILDSLIRLFHNLQLLSSNFS